MAMREVDCNYLASHVPPPAWSFSVEITAVPTLQEETVGKVDAVEEGTCSDSSTADDG
jgi:hypothetical protein